jgi:predicted CopG family antitoxin
MKARAILVSADEKKKLIKITPDVHKALGELGNKNDTYDDIIRRLIKHYKDTTAGGGKK